MLSNQNTRLLLWFLHSFLFLSMNQKKNTQNRDVMLKFSYSFTIQVSRKIALCKETEKSSRKDNVCEK